MQEPFESIQEKVERELELVLVVATLTDDRLAFVGGRPGDLQGRDRKPEDREVADPMRVCRGSPRAG